MASPIAFRLVLEGWQKFTGGLGKAEDAVQKFDRAADKAGRGASRAGRGMDVMSKSAGRGRRAMGSLKSAVAAGAAGFIGAAGLTEVVKESVLGFQESERVGKQTQAVLKSTGGAAKVTADQVADLAGRISGKVGVDDEAIQSGQNMLLTFTRIRNEAGKGNKIFDRTTAAMVDMSAATGQSMKSSAIQLGKALNDPIRGVASLTRVGVQFTDQQKDQIKAMVDSGNQLGAQKIILNEVNRQFSGSAAAQATSLDRLRVMAGNAAEWLGSKLVPALEWTATKIQAFVRWTQGSTEGAQRFRTVAGAAFGAVKAIVSGAVKVIKGVAGAIQTIIEKTEAAYNKLKSMKDTVTGWLPGNGPDYTAGEMMLEIRKRGQQAAGTFVGPVQQRATGGVVRAWERTTLVGERGPELLTLPEGARVTPAHAPQPNTGVLRVVGDIPLVIQMDGRQVWRGVKRVELAQGARA